jgi:SAM-dependent methyltransferase
MQRLAHARFEVGLAGMVPLGVRWVRLKWSRSRPAGLPSTDGRFGTETTAYVALDDIAVVGDHRGLGGDYQAITEEAFARCMEPVTIDPSGACFIDLGCGKGRALLLAAEQGFRHVIGVEFAPSLCEDASRNIEIYRDAGGATSEFEVRCEDGGAFEYPDEPLVLFLYNPFGGAVMERVIAKFEASLRAHPREAWVVYGNPRWHRLWDRSHTVARVAGSVWDPHWYMVYRAKGGSAVR